MREVCAMCVIYVTMNSDGNLQWKLAKQTSKHDYGIMHGRLKDISSLSLSRALVSFSYSNILICSSSMHWNAEIAVKYYYFHIK